jgi:3-methyladenine DNA glycosylase/8-oxoguanine DNA glycosylase
MPADAARNWLCEQAEVSSANAELALLAGAARRDVAPHASPELLAALEHYYGTPRAETRTRLAELVRRWGEFASWAAYLLVEAARRDGKVIAPATT